MIDVVVPVAIHRRSLDIAVAKVYIVSQTRAALLAAHMRVASMWTFRLARQLTRAIVPSAFPLFRHRLALVHAPRQFALLILQQRIVIHCRLHWQARRHHRHHPLRVGTNLPAGHPPEQFPQISSPARMLRPQLPHRRTPLTQVVHQLPHGVAHT